jgi:hypothetical protein
LNAPVAANESHSEAASLSRPFSVGDAAPAAFGDSFGDIAFKLGLRLSGLESFLRLRNHAPSDEKRVQISSHDWKKEFRLVHYEMLESARFSADLLRILHSGSPASEDRARMVGNFDLNAENANLTADEIFDLFSMLKQSILVSEGLLEGGAYTLSQWAAWCGMLREKFQGAPAAARLIAVAEKGGEQFLPDVLIQLLENTSLPPELDADLRQVVPRIGIILKWLGAIEKMLERDEPLKAGLLIFARVHDKIAELIGYLNNRLLRFKDEENELFTTLDCAVYAASIEQRKVYGHELAGLSALRPAPLVFARFETAHGLLNDCFQQILVNFAQLIEPDIRPTQLFPNFQTKLEQSMMLREDLWRVMQSVRGVEKNCDPAAIAKLSQDLPRFTKANLRFLFFKDWETVDRFVEEILRTENKQELVSILHRFGAYLETLLGQVNMRSVLSNHPFEPPKASGESRLERVE